MKTFLQTLFFFLQVTQICFAQWMQLGLDDKGIKDIAARNSTIFAVTTDSAVYRSTDNGITWTQNVEFDALDIAIAPNGSLFMVKYFGGPYPVQDSLYRSSDNGNTWINLNIMEQLPDLYGGPTNITISPVGFVFCGLFWAIMEGASTLIALSTDDGLTWSSPGIIGGDLFDFRGQSVITSGFEYHTHGSSAHVYLSSDNGQTWLEVGSPPNFDNNVLSMCLNGNILMVGPGLYLSIDSCSTWTQVSWLNPEAGLTIESGGLLIGTDSLGVFLFSDNGDSLGSFNEGLSNLNAHTLSMDNNGYVYVGTDNGVWQRPLSEIVTLAEEISPILPAEFLLSQNYPNPFNSSSTLKYSIQNLLK